MDTTREGGINPYAPPKSQVDEVSVATAGQPAFFPVGLLKLALMSMATFSLYQIYWFYKNWKCVQQLDDAKLNAPVRAFFYPLTSYWLFQRVRDHARAAGLNVTLQAGLLAILLFVLTAVWRLPDPYWLVTFLAFIPMLPVQSAVNEINRKAAPDADPNTRFGGWNIAGLVIGGLFFVLSIIGMLLPQA